MTVKNKSGTVRLCLILLGILLLALLLYFGAQWLENRLDKPTPVDPDDPSVYPTGYDEGPEPVLYNGKEYAYNKDLSVLLLIGVDDEQLEVDYSFRNTGQCDFLVLAVFDPSVKKYTLLQINRDTMADIPEPSLVGGAPNYRFQQIALAHTYGGGGRDSCENTVLAVSRFLYNLPIDNYFAVTMDAIPVVNDLLGGVTVTVEDDFTGVDDTLIRGKTVTLMGEHAVNYIRARSEMAEDATNLARMRRHRTYMTGLADSLKKTMDRDKGAVARIYEALEPSLVTDCSLDRALEYADAFSAYASNGIVTPEGEAKVGEQFMEFYVDDASLLEQVIRTFYLPVEESGS